MLFLFGRGLAEISAGFHAKWHLLGDQALLRPLTHGAALHPRRQRRKRLSRHPPRTTAPATDVVAFPQGLDLLVAGQLLPEDAAMLASVCRTWKAIVAPLASAISFALTRPRMGPREVQSSLHDWVPLTLFEVRSWMEGRPSNRHSR